MKILVAVALALGFISGAQASENCEILATTNVTEHYAVSAKTARESLERCAHSYHERYKDMRDLRDRINALLARDKTNEELLQLRSDVDKKVELYLGRFNKLKEDASHIGRIAM